MTKEEKLAAFDGEATQAFYALFAYIGGNRDRIIALARERHAWGHDTYGDGLLFELNTAQLCDERDQELADGLVYEMVRRRRAKAASDARGPSI